MVMTMVVMVVAVVLLLMDHMEELLAVHWLTQWLDQRRLVAGFHTVFGSHEKDHITHFSYESPIAFNLWVD
jgi:hypothetical protein